MDIEFSKMHGAGNDFILIDASKLPKGFFPDEEMIKRFCHRHRGIGADGLIVLGNEKTPESDFRMFFFNKDGTREAMCGNGLRCAALYAYKNFGLGKNLKVKTDSGILRTQIMDESSVKIEVPYLEEFKNLSLDGIDIYAGNTGVPHAVIFVENNQNIDVIKEGRRIRYHKIFEPRGTNVNFVSLARDMESVYNIRTYEKGVEEETLACGTGISASAICASLFKNAGKKIVFITPSNDKLEVEISPRDNKFDRVFLTGPAIEVFRGRTLCRFQL